MIPCVLLHGETVSRRCEVEPGTSIMDVSLRLCRGFSAPTVCLLNGQPVLRRDDGWQKTLVGANACVIFVALPLGGGGGSSPLRMIAQLAITVVAAVATWYIGGAGALAVGGWFTAGSASAWALGAAVGAMISMVGALVLNAFTKAQGLGQSETAEAASPSYSINASGNMARLGQPELDVLGKMLVTPDYVTQPYAEYDSNDQYACFVYGIGRGSYQVHALYFDDTAFWQDGAFIESGFVTEDGEEYSKDVNATLPRGGDWSAAVPAVRSGAQAKNLRVSFSFPEGFGRSWEEETQPDGHTAQVDTIEYFEDYTATAQIQYAEIDDAGTVIGEWSASQSVSMTYSDGSAQRKWRWATGAAWHGFTATVTVTAPRFARWAVRVKNVSQAIPAGTISSEVTTTDGDGYEATETVSRTYTAHEAMQLASVSSTALSAALQIVEPGGTVTLFPDNVETSSEVSGMDIYAPNEDEYTGDGWAGPYAVNSAGTKTDCIKLDYAFQNGLGYYDGENKLQNFSVSMEAQAQAINDLGAPTGEWFQIGVWTDSDKTTTPQRKTRSFPMAEGRYQVRFRRTSDTIITGQGGTDTPLDKLSWIGLRAVLPGSLTFPQSVIALRLKATNLLSQQASKQFRVLETRKLPLWTAQNGWGEPVATRSWAAAVSYVCQASYGGKMADRQLDLPTLWSIDAALAQKGWFFDAAIDQCYNMWQLVTELCQAVLVAPRLMGAKLSFVQDNPGRPVVYELNARNVIRGSFEVTYQTWNEDSPDDVVLNYLDASAGYQRRDVQATLPDSESLEPVTLDWIGITDREHAFRVATRYAAQNRWRRVTVTCQVEALGRLMNIGDVVSVNHPRFRNTAAGVVQGFNASTLALTLKPDFMAEGTSPTHISLVQPNGAVFGPVLLDSLTDNIAMLNAQDYSAIILQGGAAIETWLSDGIASQPTAYALHSSSSFQRRMLVQSVTADGLWRHTVTLVNDDPRVSQYDEMPVPAWHGRAQGSRALAAPMALRCMASSASGMVLVSWLPVPGAVEYEVQSSLTGEGWTRNGSATGTTMTIAVSTQMTFNGAMGERLWARVAAIGRDGSRSAFAQWCGEV